MQMPDAIRSLAAAIGAQGGRAFLVGGAVRDDLIDPDLPIKDFDIEVHGLPAADLLPLLARFGPVQMVGESFGVFKLSVGGHDLDVSLPRTEIKTGARHTDFLVVPDASLSIEQAARRRDFTINAMALDILTNRLFDPFDGAGDLLCGLLRVVDPRTFGEDPLRVLRAVQFTARFNLRPADRLTREILTAMVPFLADVSAERWLAESQKLLRAPHVDAGLWLAFRIGLFEQFLPDLHALASVQQHPDHHPEGSVFTHSVLSAQAAAEQNAGLPAAERETIVLAALLHDLGKVSTTDPVTFAAHGHEDAGVEPAGRVMARMGIPLDQRAVVVALIREHMQPHTLVVQPHVSRGAIRKLARRVAPATMRQLAALADADASGRQRGVMTASGDFIRRRAAEIGVTVSVPEHALTGKDLIAAGLTPGSHFGDLIRAADTLRDEDGIEDKAVLVQRLLH